VPFYIAEVDVDWHYFFVDFVDCDNLDAVLQDGQQFVVDSVEVRDFVDRLFYRCAVLALARLDVPYYEHISEFT
jgi:hypothetical protein